ncbi:predicted protein [Candida tropicalis MYA-3404]|uniref:Protein RCR2 n=1 Tax=Candida tropicalis (strain ATCC MYA-3404 / T1) TaxID=294747 RepID=C5M7J7_CANTT|nr:predicted protein [Candida tropicalis MYA-3404]EER34967.1 predicted protein [Candida tropicalis MYA-3404]KAG4408851.1 hypothetical protein JTP64_002157 [Candida tropicalis]
MFLFHENRDIVHQVLTKRDGTIAGAIAFPIALFVIGILVVITIIVQRNKQKGVPHELPHMRNSIPVPQPLSSGRVISYRDRQRQGSRTSEMTATSMIYSNQSEQPDDFVPPYTANVNENDMGYYDSEGKFHAIDYIKPPLSPPLAYTR